MLGESEKERGRRWFEMEETKKGVLQGERSFGGVSKIA